MKVSLKCEVRGGSCWNAEVIHAYAEQINCNEARLKEDPNITVIPGSIACSGCVEAVNVGVKRCSAQLTETQFAVTGETPPRPEDAFVSTTVIPGFEFSKPSTAA